MYVRADVRNLPSFSLEMLIFVVQSYADFSRLPKEKREKFVILA
jgi:hypothetical protein